MERITGHEQLHLSVLRSTEHLFIKHHLSYTSLKEGSSSMLLTKKAAEIISTETDVWKTYCMADPKVNLVPSSNICF